jgi:hypothetical protein
MIEYSKKKNWCCVKDVTGDVRMNLNPGGDPPWGIPQKKRLCCFVVSVMLEG